MVDNSLMWAHSGLPQLQQCYDKIHCKMDQEHLEHLWQTLSSAGIITIVQSAIRYYELVVPYYYKCTAQLSNNTVDNK